MKHLVRKQKSIIIVIELPKETQELYLIEILLNLYHFFIAILHDDYLTLTEGIPCDVMDSSIC